MRTIETPRDVLNCWADCRECVESETRCRHFNADAGECDSVWAARELLKLLDDAFSGDETSPEFLRVRRALSCLAYEGPERTKCASCSYLDKENDLCDNIRVAQDLRKLLPPDAGLNS